MNLERLTRGAISNGVSLVARVAISFILTPFLILYFGRAQYGVWTTLLTFTLSGSLAFFSLGFQGALIKYVAEYHAARKYRQLNEVFSATLLAYSSLGLLCGLAIAAFARFFLTHAFNIPVAYASDARAILFIFAVMIVIELPGMALSGVVEGLQRYDLMAILDVGRLACFAGVAWVILSAGHGLVALACAMLGSTVLYEMATAIVAIRLVPTLRLVSGGDKKALRDLYHLTGGLFVLRLNSLVYNNMDKVLIGAILTTTSLTDYDIANRLHGLALSVMGLAPSVVLPAAAANDAVNDVDRQRQLLLKGSKYATAVTLPFVLGLFILADQFIEYWISPKYRYVAVYARLFLSYMFLWPIVQVGWNMLVGVNRVKALIPIATLSVVVNLIVSIVFVRRVGVAGTMIGTVTANLLVVVAYMRLILRTFDVSLGMFVRTVVAPSYLVGAVVAASLTGLVAVHPPTSLIEVGLYFVTSIATFYAAFYLLFVDAAEKARFKAMLLRANPTRP